MSTVQYPIVHNVFTGTARISGMGRSQVVFPHDWNLIDKSVIGLMTITAANGDELFASVTGTALFRPDGLIADLDQFAIIEGGTGRFDGAGARSRSSARSPGPRGPWTSTWTGVSCASRPANDRPVESTHDG